MFSCVTRIRKLTSLLAIALMLVAGAGFARATSAHAPGLTMAAAPAPCDHALSDGHSATAHAATSVDVCAALCETSAPDALSVSLQVPLKPIASVELPGTIAAVDDAIGAMPMVRDGRPAERLRRPHPKPSLLTSRRLLI